ncbi:CBD9-like protein [Phaeosphaeriaceae sp. SRC1lsM3a]|nr:CBD9-like protein [Stagonospora sp. SRC1lsM3a]
MKTSTLLAGALATLSAAQTAAPYTDAKSGITFNTFQHSSGLFFGLALPANDTGNTDFIATIGGKGTGYSGVSLGSAMLNKLLFVAWPNQQSVVGSFRKTGSHASPAVATGTFSQVPIANGTYVNSTHWTYTFLCSNCIQADGTTFKATDTTPSIGFALNPSGPSQKTNAASAVGKHTAQGQAVFDLSKAKSAKFATWKSWAKPSVAQEFNA